jgi:peptidyl-prolyl cis-trans isomerase B (cyclophilin B)
MKKISTLSVLALLLNTGVFYCQSSFTYTGKPMYEILTKQNNAVLGSIIVELFPTIAPKHVRNFDSLVSTGFYDTTAFHRCVPSFVIQGGDPNSRHGPISTWGYGQPNQPTVNAEFGPVKHVRGSFSAARSSNINSATSQFFICVAAASNLNGQYSLYGRVTSGMNTVDAIVNTPKMTVAPYTSMPAQKIEMFISYIGSNDTIPNAPVLNVPVNDSMNVDDAVPLFLKWNPVNDALLYNLEIARDGAFTDIVTTFTSINTSYMLQAMTPNTTYFWRVRCDNGGNVSVYSPTWKFYTFDATGIAGVNYTENEVQVFPNPGTGSFTFSNLEKGNKVEVFDPSGKLISTVFVKDASFHLDLDGKQKGMYIYRVSNTRQEVKQGKLLLK